MAESTLKTLDDIMFVQGETPMTQENWQKYFGGVLPNGIYEGFAPRTSYQGETVNGITAGVAVYNGLVYRMADGIAVDRDVPESNGYRLISLRIYPDTGVAKIVETRGNAPVSSDETILNGIIQMTQNPVVSGRDSDQNSYVDYRLCYQGHKNSLYRAGVDLRQPALMRNGKFPNGWSIYWNNYKPSTGNIILSGNMVYNWVAPRTDWSLSVWLDPMNPPDNAKVVTNAHYVTFHEYPAIVDVTRSGDHPDFIYGMKDEFRNVIDCFGTNWERRTQPGAGHIYNDPVVWEYHDATPETPFVIQYRGKNGYNQNMFLIQMPTNGASTEWGLVEGTLSNQTDLQEALDAKADATAVYSKTDTGEILSTFYSKTETDTLLDAKANSADVYDKTETYSKTETDALLDVKANASDVYTKSDTGEIVSAFYSKQETDALLDAKVDSADVYGKTETYTKTETDALLSPKANSADVYAKSETYSKSEAYSKSEVDTALSNKANSSSVYTKTQTDTLLNAKENKSALGSLAYKSSLRYDELTGKPTLGKLASNNSVELNTSEATGILPVSKGGTGVSTSPSTIVDLGQPNKRGNPLLSSDVIGVTGRLPISNGGTGLYFNPTIITNLNSGDAVNMLGNLSSTQVQPGVFGILPQEHGGTGSSNPEEFFRSINHGYRHIYVDRQKGNDENEGTQQYPFKTISKALRDVAYFEAPPTIWLSGGTFNETSMNIPRGKVIIIDCSGITISLSSSCTIEGELIILGGDPDYPATITGTKIFVKNGGKLITTDTVVINNTGSNTFGIDVDHGICFLGGDITINANTALRAVGGIITYDNLTGTFTNKAVARNGGIISTGSSHVFS